VAASTESESTAGEPLDAGGASAQIETLRAELDTLRASLAQSDHEIDDLQLRVAEVRMPWYRNIQALVAVLALLLSLATTVVSGYWAKTQGDAAEQRLRQQEIHDARTELSGLLRSLGDLERRNEELSTLSDPLQAARLSSSYAGETSMLTIQALEIMESIPEHVTSSQYLSMALRLGAINQIGQAETLIHRALETARNSFDWVSAQRTYGSLLFLKGDFAGGRAAFAAALAESRPFAPETAVTRETDDFQTELAWAGVELGRGFCEEAKAHMDTARRFLSKPYSSPVAHQQFTAAARLVAGCVPGQGGESAAAPNGG
jgi:hypothetical protein